MIIAIALGAGVFALGVLVGKGLTHRRNPEALSKSEKRELQAHRGMFFDLSNKAVEHAVLGDNFAIIVSDTLTKHRSNLQ